MVVTSYPISWITEYSIENYSEIDPVIQSCSVSLSLFHFSEEGDKTAPETRFLERAIFHGIGNYFIGVPIAVSASHRAILTFSFRIESSAFLSELRSANAALRLREESHNLYHALEKYVPVRGFTKKILTARERECVFWISKGKTDAEIAQILGIARWTVVSHVGSAKAKLGAANRASAVLAALALNEI